MIASALVLAAIAAEPSVPVPLGVAAPSAGVLYVVDADQGVTAVELRSGKTLWKAAGPRIPLLVAPSGVATLVTSGVEVLDLRSGKRVLASESVGLPPSTHVIGNYVGHVGQGLEAKARSVDDRLELDWEIVVTHVYGMRPAEVTRTTGGAQVSMRTGKVTRRAFAPAPAPKVPAAVEQLYRRDGHTNIRTPVAGPSWAYVRMEPGEGARRAVLHRWDLVGARELAPLVLPSAPRGTGEAITQGTLDGRHLLVSWQCADASDPAIPWTCTHSQKGTGWVRWRDPTSATASRCCHRWSSTSAEWRGPPHSWRCNWMERSYGSGRCTLCRCIRRSRRSARPCSLIVARAASASFLGASGTAWTFQEDIDRAG
jgi:hypothetical protein